MGVPGAGKTTLLHHLRFELAERDQTSAGDPERIVFLVDLNRYPKISAPRLASWFSECFKRDLPGIGPLDSALATGRVWMLLDGLNEMAYGDTGEQRFDDLREYFEALPPRNRVIVTCREQDVGGVLGATAHAAVKPLSQDAVQTFLRKYVPEKADQAWADLERQGLLELYQNPYRLSLLVDELLDTGAIPEDRAAVFSSLVRRALRHNVQHKDAADWLLPYLDDTARRCIDQGVLPSAHTSNAQGALLVALGQLAFGWQLEGPGQH